MNDLHEYQNIQVNTSFNTKSLQYHLIGIMKNNLIPILIDTGATWSHVHENLATDIRKTSAETYIKYNGKEITIEKTGKIEITLENNLTLCTRIYIDNESPYEIILGMDFLDSLKNFVLTREHIDITFQNTVRRIPRIKLSESQLRSQI